MSRSVELIILPPAARGRFKLAPGSWPLALVSEEEFIGNGSNAPGLKASIPLLDGNSNELNRIRHTAAFSTGSIPLKNPSGGPKGLIGPPCHGEE